MSSKTDQFEETHRIVAAIIGDALRVSPHKITPQSNLLIDLGAESIDLVDIRFRIEERFGFKIEQKAFIEAIAPGTMDIQERLTVGNLVTFVMSRINVKEPAR
jgi:acyl carrier protein